MVPLWVVEKQGVLLERLRNIAGLTDFSFEGVRTPEEGLNKLKQLPPRQGIGIVLLHAADYPDVQRQRFIKEINQQYALVPHQVIVVVDTLEQLPVEGGFDDVVLQPLEDEALALKLRIALARYRKLVKLWEEREFLRRTLKQEEELAAKTLEQNRKLKQAYDDIGKVNEQLLKANKELEKIAHHDALSGLLNRIALFYSIDAEIERSLRSGSPLTGIMIDLDHFKSVNDNYGHPCGDEVIRKTGNWLLSNLRKYDIAGRYGGEEFFVVLPNTRLSHGLKIAERFRKTIQANPIPCGSLSICITASMGVAEHQKGETRDMWIQRCDRAMYMAKHRGRNQVVADIFPME